MKTITIEVDASQAKEWIAEVAGGSIDVFRTTHAGYWLRGVEFVEKRGWLVFNDEGDYPVCDKDAIKAWRAGRALPEGYYRLDRAVALSAWKEGVKRWGVGWFHDQDATAWDIVLQIAILGDVIYG